MSDPSDSDFPDERARQELREVLAARFGKPEVAAQLGSSYLEMFALASDGDTLLCLRLNTLNPDKIASTFRGAEDMLAYCTARDLVPRALVVAEARGSADHHDRLDLHLIETIARGGSVSRILWRDATTVSRSFICARQHLSAITDAGVELLLIDHGPIDLDPSWPAQ